MLSFLNTTRKFNVLSTKTVSQTARYLSNTIASSSAMNVYKKSCYFKIDFKINEDRPVTDAVLRFSALILAV